MRFLRHLYLNFVALAVCLFLVSAVATNANGLQESGKDKTQDDKKNIDKKIDDGYAQTGSVVAMYPNYNTWWAAGGSNGNASVDWGDADSLPDSHNANQIRR